MAFKSRSQRKTKRLPQSTTVEISPDANSFNLQIFEGSLEVLTGSDKKRKWKKTHVVLQSGKGVFTTLLYYKKPSRFIAKLAPLEKIDLQLGFDVSVGEIIKKNKYIININIHEKKGGTIQLAADSEELRSMWIHELITKRVVDPISSDCLQWFVVRIKDTVGTNRLRLSGKCTLCIYKDRVVLATTSGTMLGDFPLDVIKSYKSSDEFHLNLSANSMYGELTLFIITNQTYELFERIHRLKMESMGRDVELPSLTSSIMYSKKMSPDDSALTRPNRRPSKRDYRGLLQDSASETDILAAVRSCDKPPKPPLSRPKLMLPQIPAVRSLSNATASMKPRVPITRIHSPNLYGRHTSEFLEISPEYPNFGTPGRRPSEPKMLHSDRRIMAHFPAPDSPISPSSRTHSQFTSPDLYDHVIFKPRSEFNSISEASASQTLTTTTPYDSIKSVTSHKKVNIYETLSFGESDRIQAYLKAPRDPNEVPDIPMNYPNPPKRSISDSQKEIAPKTSLSNSYNAQNKPEQLDNSFSSQNISVFSTTPPPPLPLPLPPHKEGPESPKKLDQGKDYDFDQFHDSPIKRGMAYDSNRHNSSLRSLDSYKRTSKNNQYEIIHNGFNSLGSGARRAARRIKLGKAKSEMPPGMLATETKKPDNSLKNKKASTRPSSFNVTPKKSWEVV